jgi:Voltage gated chloride channel
VRHQRRAMQVTLWAPAAAGAGVTLVMAYLNGNHIPNLLRVRTMVTKIIGCAFGVASGLAIGPEGPMVHIGACIASNITYGTSRQYRWLRWVVPWFRCLVEVDPDDNSEDDSDDGDGAAAPVDVVTGDGGDSAAATAAEEAVPGVRAICATCEELHEDSEHREFISAGASAGLSVRAVR